MSTFVLTNIGYLLTLEGAVKKQGRRIGPADLSPIRDAALAVSAGKVQWAGPKNELPSKFKKHKLINAREQTVMPGFVDSHTHLVFAGDRSREFEMRLAGATYQHIAQSGGGIVKSTSSTRAASHEELLKLAEKRVATFLGQGVTTIEIKTGYGLNFESEKKCLEVIRELKETSLATIKSTFLAAHAVPQEFTGRRKEYVEVITQDWLPRLREYCDAVDMFLDQGYFDTADADMLLSEAQRLKLPIKLHADELELTGGTEAAIRFGALSADHLLKIGPSQISALAASSTTACLLPTTAFFLKTSYAPARALLDAGARVALATDFNPGTSPTQDVSLVALLSALQMGMRTDEIIVSMTLNGAYALGLEKTKGSLLPGFDADFIMFEGESPARLFYEFGQVSRNLKVWAEGNAV